MGGSANELMHLTLTLCTISGSSCYYRAREFICVLTSLPEKLSVIVRHRALLVV